MVSGKVDNHRSRNYGYCICSEIKDISLSGVEEHVLGNLCQGCKSQTADNRQCKGIPLEKLIGDSMPACKPGYERIGEKHYEMGITVKPYTKKIFP